MTFDFKPAIRMKRSAAEDLGRQNRVVQVGDHVPVTEGGAVRLGSRELVSIATLE
ncbi:MAG TPA: hypothetical protein VEQ11_09145 [Chloroflexota bacterium]|nr:hypothetical protein [Chloroflexota bacterium]